MRKKLNFSRVPFSVAVVAIMVVCPMATECDAAAKFVIQDSQPDELSEEEAKSIKIADRFFSILEKSPRRGTALERVYGHHVEFGTLDEFLKGLRDRIEANPEDGDGWMLLGMFEAHRGQDAEAVDAFSKAETFRTEDAMPSYYLGQSLLLIGQPEKAVEAFERAVDRKPRRPDMLEIFRQLGRVHQRAQRTEEALKVWDRLEKLFPDDARVQEQIAITMVEEGEYDLALPRYENLAKIVKDDYRRVTFNIEAAELKIRLNKRDEGIADLEKLLADLNPTGWLFRDVRRRIEDIFLRSGDQDGLVTYYQKWIDKNPEDIGAIARLARFLASSARVEEASQWMEMALTLAPKRTDLRKSFINQLVNDQRYTEASKQYAELVKSAPGNPDFLRDWGKLVMKDRSVEKDKRREQAVKIWSRIVEARPNDALTHAQVADLYRQSGLEAEAIERYENAIELAPGEAQYREYLGEYFHILKRPDDALKIWESIAEGKRNTAENVARLAEVYNSFGYLPQAVEKIAAACELDPKEFVLQLKAAEYHMRDGKFDKSLAYNTAANALSASDEESELALKNRIEIFQTNRKLEEEIDRLREQAQSAGKPTVDAWHTLARYLEASRNWPDATEALEKALAIDDKSIPVLTTSARIAETSGDYGRAAAENRKLASIDRRLRSEHLMNVARLEAQLGNRDQAMAAAKELIVAAPGNTDNYQFYSQLCYRLGETEEALDALRKAVRINPTEPSLTMALGRSLAEEFRTDEAIEVYWRAFEKSDEIDDRTSLVQKLASLYEQQNQFDKLLERLERDRREESKRREMTICIAQAHNSTGDYGTARRELESLLTDNTRDTNLLQQLSKLCESGSDLDAAVAYQTQLTKIAPGHESEFRLAKLLFSSGKREAASEIFVKLTSREENPVRLLRSVDSLLQRSNFESVVKITEPLLSESRDNWELLYREGVALAKQEKVDEAKIRFERILSLSFPHDKMGVAAEERFKRASKKAKSNNNQGIRSQIKERPSAFQLARSQAGSAKQAVGLSQQSYYGGNQLPPLWTPSHYGVARMAAYAWLTRFESDVEIEKDVAAISEDETDDEDDDEEEPEVASFTDSIVEKGKKEDADPNEILDWLYVESLRDGYKEIFEISKRLAIDGGKQEQQFFLSSLPMRGIDSKTARQNNQQEVQDPDPLSEADIELMLKCFKATAKEDDAFGSALGSGQVIYSGGQMYVRVGNSWQSVGGQRGSLAQVVKELKLASKTELAEKMINEKVDAAKKPTQLAQAMLMLISEKKTDRVDEYFAKWKTAAAEEIELAPVKLSRRGNSTNKHSANQTAQVLGLIRKWTGPLAAEEENAKVLSIINDVLDIEMKERVKKRVQAKASRKRNSRSRSTYYDNDIPYQYGDEASTTSVDYPRPSDYLSTTGIHMLRQAYETLKKNEVEEDLTTMVRERVKKAETDSPESLMYEQMLMATLLFWQDEKDEAIEMFRAVSVQLKDDPQFQFEIASLYEKLGEHDEALSIIEAIEPREQKLVQQKETKVLTLAERLGDLDRARAAAERLFGLRLKAQTQLSLVSNMKRLGMVEMADAVVSRAQRRSGQKIPAMASLMSLYQGQGKPELATQVAHRILQKTRSSVSQAAMINRNRRYGRSSNSNESHRRAAISTLQQTGALNSVIERLEKQQERSPESPAIYEQLIEFYMQTNNSDKLLPMLETAVKSRPKSSYFREQLAKQYSAKGKNEEACDQYAAAIRENPSMLSDDYYEIKQFFKSANRSSDLLKLFQDINIREIGQPYYVANFASELLQESQQANTDAMSDEEKKANEATELAAIQLAEKIFDEYPNYRRYVIQNFDGEDVWKNKRLFNLARKSIIPTKSQAKSDPWYGLNDISSYSGNGEVNSMFHDVFEGIEGTDQEKVLCESIEKNIAKKPDWLAGKIMLAMFDVRGDREEKAKESLTAIFADEKVADTVRGDTAWLVAQELEKFPETREIAVKLLEKVAKKTDNNNDNEIQYSAAGKLVMLYLDSDEKDKARDLLLEAAKKKTHQNYDRQYQMYQRGQTVFWVTNKLLEIDCSADAVSLMQGMLNDQAVIDGWTQWGGNDISVANALYAKSLERAMADEDTAGVAEKIIAVRDKPRAGDGAFDLQVGVSVVSNNRARTRYVIRNGRREAVVAKASAPEIECKFFKLLDTLSKKDIGKQLLEKRLKQLQTAMPDDKTIAIANTWFQLQNAPEESAAAEALLELIRKNPLDEIREGRRPNSRQRRQAMQHVALWPISKEYLSSKEPKFQKLGKDLGELAISGARRQTDKQFQHRMLFEWGTMAAKADNLEEAESKWSQLLDEVTRRPTRKKKAKPTDAIPGAPIPQRAPGTSMKLDHSQGVGIAPQPLVVRVGERCQSPSMYVGINFPQQDTPQEKTETKSPALIAPLTNSQFQTALQIAAAAADNDMPELSKRAMREMLKGGLPVADPTFGDSNSNSRSAAMVYVSPAARAATAQPGNATSAASFGSQIRTILDVWKDKEEGYDPIEVYEMTVAKIFPENRPSEILLYEQSSSIRNATVSSLARTVVSWAAKADRLDDFKKRIAEREAEPRAQVQAMVLNGMVALEQKDIPAINANLAKLVQRVTKQPVPRDVDLACHIAVPAWTADDSLREQCIEIYRKKLAANKKSELGKIATRVNRHLAANGGEAEVRKFFEGYLAAQQEQYANYGGDYGIYQMQRSLYRVSGDLAKSNLSELALEYIGRGKDLKHDRNYGDNSDNDGWIETAKRIRAMPAEKRYATLKDWTLPKPDRQTVRFSSAWSTNSGDELADFRVPGVRDLPDATLPGLHCNFLDLIDAAAEAGKMDDLKQSVAAVDTKKHPEVEGLQVCIAIRSDDPAAEEIVRKYIKERPERQKHKTLDQNVNHWSEHLACRLSAQKSEELGKLFDDSRWKIIQQNVGGTGKVVRRDYEIRRAKFLDTNVQPGTFDPLLHWLPRYHATRSNGTVNSWTVSDGDQLTALGSDSKSTYWLKYPLKGDFKFSCEAYSSGNSSAEIAFGGAMVQSQYRRNGAYVMVNSVANHDAIYRPTNGTVKQQQYGLLTIEVQDGVMKQALNGKVLYQEKLTGSYPWLALFTNSTSLTAWRNPIFEGTPEIVTEVALIDGNRMEGWSTGGESQIAFRGLAEPKPKELEEQEVAETKEKKPEEYDWHAKEGVLYGKANDKAKEGSDSVISYRRPISDGDRLSFEFFYEPGKKMANPTIGSVIVGLTEGEKVQELVAGDSELDEYATFVNVIDSPHAVETVKLIANDWNSVESRIVGDNAEVEVNGVVVWRRPVTKLDSLFAGIQKYKKYSAEIRKLRLKGDWPEKFSEGLRESAFASERSLEKKDHDLMAEVIGDRFKNVEMLALYDDANLKVSTESAERYNQFRKWVFPGYGHGVRMDYRTVPKKIRTSEQLAADNESEIECPAWDMIELAKEAGKLDELEEAIGALEIPKDKLLPKFRDMTALKALLAIAKEDDETARGYLNEIYASVVAVEEKAKKDEKENENHSAPSIDRTSIMVPTWFATNRPALLDCATSLQTKCQSGLGNAILARIEKRSDTMATTKPLTQWNAAHTGIQSINQQGGYLDQWRMSAMGVLERSPGHVSTPLYFQSPLKGKFEITAEVLRKSGAQCWLDYGGYAAIPDGKRFRSRIAGNANRSSSEKSKKQVPRLHSVVQYRIAVDGNNVETYVNDVRVSRHEFDQAPQPWFSLQTNVGSARPILQNVRITGQPEIPTEIDLLAADRPQWSGAFKRFKESTDDQNRHYSHPGSVPADPWLLKKGELTAGSLKMSHPDRHVFKESRLFYQRPMLEDGEFEFEMFADDEKLKLCHVSLGRTALLLKEDGVWRHEIGGYDGTEETEDEKIADSSGVELKNEDWNQVLIRLKGDSATLLVNDQEVATFEVADAPSLRFPGLFRFSDQSNAQVRNIKYRGEWPKMLPSVEQQELAQNSTDPFEGAVVGEAKVFDLSKSIEELKTVGLEVTDGGQIETTSNGVKISTRKNADSAKWPAFKSMVSAKDDFDLSVGFSDLKIANVTGWGCGLDLQVDFDCVESKSLTIGMRRDKDNAMFIIAQREYDDPNGKRSYETTKLHEPFEKGTLRMVRRGGKVYALAAADGGKHRLIASYIVGKQLASAISVTGRSATDTAELDVVVKEISLKLAE